MSGENPRLCNQGILNYLLIILRRDKNFVKFWRIIKLMINEPALEKAVEQLQKSKANVWYTLVGCFEMCSVEYLHYS